MNTFYLNRRRSGTEEMLLFNENAKNVLEENQNLQQRLNELNQKLNLRNIELYNLETRIENLDIFEQHLTSLNLRCEFLDKQISHLESKPRLFNTAEITGQKNPFKDTSPRRIERKATETTLQNLCTEFQYLKNQLETANNQVLNDTSVLDDSNISQTSGNRSSSLFSASNASEVDTIITENDEVNPQMGSYSGINTKSSHPKSESRYKNKEKKLMKMESFLNFDDRISREAAISPKIEATPLRGFKINGGRNTNSFHVETGESLARHKRSTKSLRKKLEMAELPPIEEQINENFYNSLEELHKDTEKYEAMDLINEEPEGQEEYGFDCDDPVIAEGNKWHRRHNSLPDSIDGNSNSVIRDDVLRHFISYDTALNKKDTLKSYEYGENIISAEDPFIISSSPMSSNFDTEMGIRNQEYSSHEYYGSDFQSEHESEESYGGENVTSIIVKKQSSLSLHRFKSHESIFSTVSNTKPNNHPRFDPQRERRLDLKAQTMKWLKPMYPTVSSSIQDTSVIQPQVNLSRSTNAHDDIISILHSGGSKITELSKASVATELSTNSELLAPIDISPRTPARINTKEQNESLLSSWIPQKLFSTPHSIGNSAPIPINQSQLTTSNDREQFEHHNENGSWFSNLIPNSAFTNPEIGKLIGQPSSKFSSKENQLSTPKFPKRFKNTIPLNSTTQTERTSAYNGSSSSLTFGKHGKVILRHGYGSGFNNNVVSTRISHGALREALELDIN